MTLSLLCITEAPLCITRPISDIECLEGETVSFVCEVNKENAPAMWLKDGVIITEEDGYEFIMDGKRHILKIPDVTIDHDAEFTVKINGCESKARLRVEGRSKHCCFSVFFKSKFGFTVSKINTVL